jgi:hypothetical protein
VRANFIKKNGSKKLDYIEVKETPIVGKKVCRKASITQSRQGHGFTNWLAPEKVLYEIDLEQNNDNGIMNNDSNKPSIESLNELKRKFN